MSVRIESILAARGRITSHNEYGAGRGKRQMERTKSRTKWHKAQENLCSCACHTDADGVFTRLPLTEFDCHFPSRRTDCYVPESQTEYRSEPQHKMLH